MPQFDPKAGTFVLSEAEKQEISAAAAAGATRYVALKQAGKSSEAGDVKKGTVGSITAILLRGIPFPADFLIPVINKTARMIAAGFATQFWDYALKEAQAQARVEAGIPWYLWVAGAGLGAKIFGLI